MNDKVRVVNERIHWPLFLFLMVFIVSCDSELSEEAENTVYNGPMRTLENAQIFHSDSGLVKAKVFTKKMLYLQSQDREAPEGFFTTFYEKDGNESATLEADYAYYNNNDKKWLARGNVIIQNKINNETLNTEELYWDPQTGDVYTDKFVKIETPEEIITGTGLDAKQDFSTWSIKQPEAIFVIEEDGTE